MGLDNDQIILLYSLIENSLIVDVSEKFNFKSQEFKSS